MSLEEGASNLIPGGLWIGAGESGNFIKEANLWPGGDLELFLARLVPVVFKSSFEDLLLWVAYVVRSYVFPHAEVGIEGHCLIHYLSLHQ